MWSLKNRSDLLNIYFIIYWFPSGMRHAFHLYRVSREQIDWEFDLFNGVRSPSNRGVSILYFTEKSGTKWPACERPGHWSTTQPFWSAPCVLLLRGIVGIFWKGGRNLQGFIRIQASFFTIPRQISLPVAELWCWINRSKTVWHLMRNF